MKSKKKKIGLISLAIVGGILALLIILPIVFKDKIKEIALKEVNKQLKADVGFDKLSVSLIKNFPNASISVKDLYVAGRDDFAGDTLLATKSLTVVVNMGSIFSADGFEIKKFVIDDTKIFAHQLEDGRANWEIVPESDEIEIDDDAPSAFSLQLKDVRLTNTNITFVSDTAKMAATINDINLKLNGDFTADNTLLKTNLNIGAISFWDDGLRLAHNLSLDFKADIEAYFNESKYVLANNEININAIPLSINGWVQMPDDAIDMDLVLNAEKVDFKSLLSLVPAIYSSEFDKLTADGNVSLTGFLKGNMEGDVFPSFDFKLNVDNGRFSYPDLPKSIDNVQVASHISNAGGSLDNTVVDVSKLSFNMGGNPFSAKLNVSHPISNMNFLFVADGKLDLGMIKDVYPLEKGTELNGLLTMNIDAAGKMSYLENERYEDFKFGGNINVKDMLVDIADVEKGIAVSNANFIFNDRYLDLADLNVKIGENDLRGTGKVENYLAYALRNSTLKGDLTIQSNYFNLNDFMSSEEAEEVKKDSDTAKVSLSVIEVPKNLNITLNGNFKKLIFDEMNLENAEAQLHVVDGELKINKMNVNAFGGTMALNGKYSTKNPSEPNVDFDVDLKQISFAEIMSQVESLRKFAPIFSMLDGRFDTKLSLNTLLSGDMMPILTSMLSSGSFKAELVTLKGDNNVLSELASKLKIEKLSNISLKDLALSFAIKDGMVETKPFNLNIKDYNLNIGGLTGLDQSIKYTGSIKMPDKLNLKQFQTIGFKIGGTFKDPKVELDLKGTLDNILSGEKDKVMDKVDSMKDQLTDKATDAADKAKQEAQKRAEQIMEQANKQSERLLNVAKAQGDSIINKAKNPVAKGLAKKAAEELLKQAQKQSDAITEKAKIEAEQATKNE
ncbi:MAG: hypothetical protein GXZ03_01575 [Proteiniphilum sp.]|nr:hypothetical protein [Proteiniphilum sp.]